jgi:signal transduction histidine kinase
VVEFAPFLWRENGDFFTAQQFPRFVPGRRGWLEFGDLARAARCNKFSQFLIRLHEFIIAPLTAVGKGRGVSPVPNLAGLCRWGLICGTAGGMLDEMGVPNTPTTLSAAQLGELNDKLAHMRHEINNQLAMVVAALELMRYRPEMRDKMLTTISQQPPVIMAEVAKFSAEFERAFGITRG